MESRILREAMTAYQAVYDPELRQQLEEKQVFENWVNSLVEEGHDLSEYTWEDMYEVYIAEIGVNFGGQAAVDRVRAQAAQERKSASRIDTLRQQRFGSGGSPSAGKDRMGNVTKPTSSPTPKPAAAPAPKPAAAPAPKPAAAPAPKPVATAPRPTTAPAAKPAPTVSAKPPSGPGYKKDTSITDMIGRSQIRQGAPINTGSASSDIRSMALRGTLAGGSTPSPTSKSAPSRPMGSRKPGSIVSGLDMFDLVKGYLLDEGYADTEEAAIKIMANMSEEWRQSIINNK